MSEETKKESSNELLYSVVKFKENGISLFECIPTVWFANKEKTCFFRPPKSERNLMVRALTKEKPGDSWHKVECRVVNDEYTTYSRGFGIVRDSKDTSISTQAKEIKGFKHSFTKPNETNARTNVGEPKKVKLKKTEVKDAGLNLAEVNIEN